MALNGGYFRSPRRRPPPTISLSSATLTTIFYAVTLILSSLLLPKDRINEVKFSGFAAAVDGQITQRMSDATAKLGTDLYQFLHNAVQYDTLEREFVGNMHNIKRLDDDTISSIMDRLNESVSNMMDEKVSMVKRMVFSLENMYREYDWDHRPNFAAPEYKYYNAKQIRDALYGENIASLGFPNLTDIERDEKFNWMPVSWSHSTIHVPTNIWNADSRVLNFVRWTAKMDQIFPDYANRPDTNFQFFGSANGTLRIYPGIPWSMETATHPDLYDVRLTEWYVRAAASPKDVIIILDNSGSMLGVRSQIARRAISDILDTLHVDDFFNIIIAGEEATFLVPCFQGTLLQARGTVKDTIVEQLMDLVPEKVAKFNDSLALAFETLYKFRREGRGSLCNQALMIITDGLEDTFEDIFRQYNVDKKVRVFTYLVGRDSTRFQEANQIACDNRGFYVRLRTMADVRENIQKYYHIMAKPMVIEKQHKTLWTRFYPGQDILGRYKRSLPTPTTRANVLFDVVELTQAPYRFDQTKEDVSKQGLLTTVAQPVFDRRNISTGTLLGVFGTDVPVSEIERRLAPYKFGVGAYSFGINRNGFTLFHPNINPFYVDHYDNVQRRPHFSEVDLTQLEDYALPPLIDAAVEETMRMIARRKQQDEEQQLLMNGGGDEAGDNVTEPSVESLPVLNTPAAESIIAQQQRNMMQSSSNFNNNNNNNERMNGKYELRERMISMPSGRIEYLNHRLALKEPRVIVKRYRYFFRAISPSPHSIALAVPVDNVVSAWDGAELRSDNDFERYFANSRWIIHPDWHYADTPDCDLFPALTDCKRPKSKEQLLLDVLDTVQIEPLKTLVPEVDVFSKRTLGPTLLEQLLFDAKHTSPIVDQWQQRELDALSQGIDTVFVATRSGYTRWLDYENWDIMPLIDRSVEPLTMLPPQRRYLQLLDQQYRESQYWRDFRHFFDVYPRALQEAFAERASNVPDEELLVSFPFHNFSSKTVNISKVAGNDTDIADQLNKLFTYNRTFVTLTMPLRISHMGKKAATVGVAGINVKYKHFFDFIERRLGSLCVKKDRLCYVLDENGYIVYMKNGGQLLLDEEERDASLDSYQMFKAYFGHARSNIMAQLVARRIFNKTSVYRSQEMCTPAPPPAAVPEAAGHNGNGAPPDGALSSVIRMGGMLQFFLRDALPMIMNNGRLVMQLLMERAVVTTLHVAYWLTNIVAEASSSSSTPMANKEYYFVPPTFIIDEHGQRINVSKSTFPPVPTPKKPCKTKTDIYTINRERLGRGSAFQMQCVNAEDYGCDVTVNIAPVAKTNLVLITLDNDRMAMGDKLCSCNNNIDDVTVRPREIKWATDEFCLATKITPFRQGPKECFATLDSEFTGFCGGASIAKPLLSLFLAMLSITVIVGGFSSSSLSGAALTKI